MNTRININGIEIWATLKQRDYPKKWYGESRANNVNVFLIHLKKNGTEVRFTFYDSIYNCQRGVTKMDADALKNALECILSDATYGNGTFSDYCDELGYDEYEDGNKVRRIYNACRDTLDKLLTIMSEDDIYEILEKVR